jgi:tRNA nucleotidyltransferase (CCA-adding enzyme)
VRNVHATLSFETLEAFIVLCDEYRAPPASPP